MLSRVSGISSSGTIRIADKIRKMLSAGDEVINLAGFNPDFDIADHIKNSAKRALDKGYTSLTIQGVF